MARNIIPCDLNAGTGTFYALVWNFEGQVWDTTGTPAFETYATAQLANYDVALTQDGTASEHWSFEFPATILPGIYSFAVHERVGGAPAEGDPVVFTGVVEWDGVGVVNGSVYHMRIEVTFDDAAATPADEYTAVLFQNGIRVTSGITSPTLQLILRADGTDLLAATAMTQIGSTGAYKYDASGGNRVTAGTNALAVVSMTHEGVARTWTQIITRDLL